MLTRTLVPHLASLPQPAPACAFPHSLSDGPVQEVAPQANTLQPQVAPKHVHRRRHGLLLVAAQVQGQRDELRLSGERGGQHLEVDRGGGEQRDAMLRRCGTGNDIDCVIGVWA